MIFVRLLQTSSRSFIQKNYNLFSPSNFYNKRLIPLDKNPGLRSIGAEEIIRRIAGKAAIMRCKKDVTKAARSLQLSAGWMMVLKLLFMP